MLVFISGGVRSGKSLLGEKLAADLAGENRKIYLATARQYDQEIKERIAIHQQNRANKGFITIDKSFAIGDAAAFFEPKDTIMLDCLGTLLANEMFDRNQKSVCQKIMNDLYLIRAKAANLIIISNEVFADGIRYEKPIEDYIRNLAKLHIKLAQASDVAIECVYSVHKCFKGAIPK